MILLLLFLAILFLIASFEWLKMAKKKDLKFFGISFLTESKIINQLSSLKDNLLVNDSAKFSRAIKKLILE